MVENSKINKLAGTNYDKKFQKTVQKKTKSHIIDSSEREIS